MTSPDVLRMLDDVPLVAILRGLTPDEAVEIGEAIVRSGIRFLEVPLNSPEPLRSVRLLRDAFDGRAVVGAGTVLDATAVAAVAEAGGQVIISPNTEVNVIAATNAASLVSMPGFFTPTEAFAALRAGADLLKLFPAEVAGPSGLKAIRAVLPGSTRIYAVGGVEPVGVGTWAAAGASGLGLGSGLFKPGWTSAQVEKAALAFVAAWESRAVKS